MTTELSPGTSTVEETRPRTSSGDDGDHERFSHYVPKHLLMQAMVEGTPVRALCGKLWVPSRDPQRFPVCPECRERWESLGGGGGADGDGDDSTR